MSSKPKFILDQDLRDIPEDANALKKIIQLLEIELSSTSEAERKVTLLGEMGTYRRSLGDLETAEKNLKDALAIISSHNLGVRREVQQKIRLANVFQWKKNFAQSNLLFDEVIHLCRTNSEANVYLDFALQHAGKNHFDQKDYNLALKLFREALEIRKLASVSNELIASTEAAIARTLEQLS